MKKHLRVLGVLVCPKLRSNKNLVAAIKLAKQLKRKLVAVVLVKAKSVKRQAVEPPLHMPQ